jgi:hypothetical protein
MNRIGFSTSGAVVEKIVGNIREDISGDVIFTFSKNLYR